MREATNTATIEAVGANGAQTLNHFQHATHRTSDGKTMRLPVRVAGDHITMEPQSRS